MYSKVLSFCLCFIFSSQIGYAQPTDYLLQTTNNKAIKQGYVDTPDGQIHYWTAGEGTALLLIHQTASSSEEYASLVPFLKDNYRLIAYDWIGHGNSDDATLPAGVEEFTENAVAVLKHLNIKKCHVLGHHGGALVAMNLAYKYPEMVYKMVLSGTSGLKKPEETKKFSQSLDMKKRDILDKEGQSLLDAWGRYTNYLPDAPPEQVLIPFINNINGRLRPYKAMGQILQWDRKPALYSLKMSILLTQGTADNFVSHQETLLKILPNSERKTIDNGGAFMFFDKAKECAAIIKPFLDKPIVGMEGSAKEKMEDRHILFKRGNILVSNLERSLKVYRDILGFSVFKISSSSKGSYSYPVFKIPKKANLRFATLSSPTQVRTFALTEVTGIELPKPTVPLMSAAVINVDDIDKVMTKINAEGLDTTKPKIADGQDFKFKEQAFVDHDGHLIVLYEILDK